MKSKFVIPFFFMMSFPTLLFSQIEKLELLNNVVPSKELVEISVEARITQELIALKSNLSRIESEIQTIDIRNYGIREYEEYVIDIDSPVENLEEAIYFGNLTVDIMVNIFDLFSSSGGLQIPSGTTLLVDLNSEIQRIENMIVDLQNKRQEYSTAFENFDQMANQLYNLLSSVLRAMNEMRSITIRNLN